MDGLGCQTMWLLLDIVGKGGLFGSFNMYEIKINCILS
ncbi:hypothetical protein AO368_1869 [Moraxella catarrhalis]|nr:hypothetical protein AO368_1869 [Moraxella catarrhalis]